MKERKVSFEIKKLDNMIERKIFNGAPKKRLTNTQARILKFLFINQNIPIYQSDIEKEIGVRRSTMSGILDTMAKNNLIIRKISLVDSRKKKVELTSYSLNKYKEIESKISSFEKVLLKGVTKEEKDLFIKIIDKLKDNLN